MGVGLMVVGEILDRKAAPAHYGRSLKANRKPAEPAAVFVQLVLGDVSEAYPGCLTQRSLLQRAVGPCIWEFVDDIASGASQEEPAGYDRFEDVETDVGWGVLPEVKEVVTYVLGSCHGRSVSASYPRCNRALRWHRALVRSSRGCPPGGIRLLRFVHRAEQMRASSRGGELSRPHMEVPGSLGN